MLAGARRAFELKDRMEVSEELGKSSNYQGGIGVPKPGKRGNPGFDGGKLQERETEVQTQWSGSEVGPR